MVEISAPVQLDKDGTHLLIPMFLILPLSTSSSSFCHVGYGSAVRSSSITLLPSFLNATGLVENQQNAQAGEELPTSGSSTSRDSQYQAWKAIGLVRSQCPQVRGNYSKAVASQQEIELIESKVLPLT